MIGEDGENLKDEDMETLDEAVREEEEEETSERTESSKEGRNNNGNLNLEPETDGLRTVCSR